MTKEEAIERLSEHTQYFVSVNDLDALHMAIEALERDDPEVEFKERFERSTYCGYTLKELLMFADACKRQGITEEHLHIFWKNAECVYNYIMELIDEGFKKSIKRTFYR